VGDTPTNRWIEALRSSRLLRDFAYVHLATHCSLSWYSALHCAGSCAAAAGKVSLAPANGPTKSNNGHASRNSELHLHTRRWVGQGFFRHVAAGTVRETR
jgi:hypothetical protein